MDAFFVAVPPLLIGVLLVPFAMLLVFRFLNDCIVSSAHGSRGNYSPRTITVDCGGATGGYKTLALSEGRVTTYCAAAHQVTAPEGDQYFNF